MLKLSSMTHCSATVDVVTTFALRSFQCVCQILTSMLPSLFVVLLTCVFLCYAYVFCGCNFSHILNGLPIVFLCLRLAKFSSPLAADPLHLLLHISILTAVKPSQLVFRGDPTSSPPCRSFP